VGGGRRPGEPARRTDGNAGNWQAARLVANASMLVG